MGGGTGFFTTGGSPTTIGGASTGTVAAVTQPKAAESVPGATVIDGDRPWFVCRDAHGAITGVKYHNLSIPLAVISRLMQKAVLHGWSFLDPKWQEDLYHEALRELIIGD